MSGNYPVRVISKGDDDSGSVATQDLLTSDEEWDSLGEDDNIR